jgi:hypothetical protein
MPRDGETASTCTRHKAYGITDREDIIPCLVYFFWEQETKVNGEGKGGHTVLVCHLISFGMEIGPLNFLIESWIDKCDGEHGGRVIGKVRVTCVTNVPAELVSNLPHPCLCLVDDNDTGSRGSSDR